MNNIVSLLHLSDSIDEKLTESKGKGLLARKLQLDNEHEENHNDSPFLIRYLIIVIDCSKSMKHNDYKPSRFRVTLKALEV